MQNALKYSDRWTLFWIIYFDLEIIWNVNLKFKFSTGKKSENLNSFQKSLRNCWTRNLKEKRRLRISQEDADYLSRESSKSHEQARSRLCLFTCQFKMIHPVKPTDRASSRLSFCARDPLRMCCRTVASRRVASLTTIVHFHLLSGARTLIPLRASPSSRDEGGLVQKLKRSGGYVARKREPGGLCSRLIF